ncbi:MAG: 4-hydroxybenzoyl-CoA thioesterase [Planctomycetaceae bacterium]|jgi:YbgC/YbaW family acyl-CoA thioester hydrolase|nr:4-hydroxybenzoyl-CoA thioesterase [Planctomycetaceae bacterium]MDP7273964.1 thioesterase family protein [Planctomycetaceae bacterium]
MAQAFTTTRRIEFADTDMAGLIHFSCFYRLMEEAEHEFLRSMGTSVIDRQDDGTTVSWPRLSAECSFHAPVLFEDELEIRISVRHLGNSSLTLAYEFRRDESLVAQGVMKTVCCQVTGGSELKSMTIPEPLHSRLAELEVAE